MDHGFELNTGSIGFLVGSARGSNQGSRVLERVSLMFLKTLNILIAEWIKIPTEGLSPMLERKLHERLVFTNPDYEMRHNRGEWIGNIPPQINCLRQKGRNYLIPRGFLDQLLDLCKRYQQPYRVIDKRRSFDPLPIEFHGELKSYQQDAAEAVLDKDFATLVGGHKSGKTVIALYILAQRRQPTLIVIPKLELLEGWLTKIENFLQIPRSEIGIMTTGNHTIGNQITIAHSGELSRYWRKIWDQAGLLIMDECQRCPSKVITGLVPNFDCRYMLGLSNTTQRKDKLSRLLYYYIGDVVYTINEKDAKAGRGIIHAHVVARSTEFDYPYHSRADYIPMARALMEDPVRNAAIADDIARESEAAKGQLLVISGGEEQNRILSEALAQRGVQTVTLVDPPSSNDLDEEGTESWFCPKIDVPGQSTAVLVSADAMDRCAPHVNASAVFLAFPLYFRKTLADALREINASGRNGDGRLKIFDYVDRRIGLLENYFRMRSYNYGVHPDLLLNPDQN
jgi:hypothetical protein